MGNISYRDLSKSVLKKIILTYNSKCLNLKTLILLVVFSLYSNLSFSQNSEKNRESSILEQRAIMVFNLCEQVKWPKIKQMTTLKIGVMGPDTIKKSLFDISNNRRIYDKLIEVKRINSVDDIQYCNVVYVNSTYEYLIKAILNSTKGKEILIITEGYPTHSSMINMVQVGDTYEYDINRQFIREANLKITPVLASYAVTSKEIKDKLYKKVEQNLYIANREKAEQKKIIETHIKTIGSQIDDINKKDKVIIDKEHSITNLSRESELKNKRLEESLVFELELEEKLEKQLYKINAQQLEIDSVNLEIQNQQKVLTVQNIHIKEKEDILAEKNIIISTQRQYNILLSILSCLLFIVSISLLVAYIKNKKLNFRLKAQHVEINHQSKQLVSKNKELEQFVYIASHDLQEPLNTISSFIDVIDSEYNSSFDDDGKQMLGFIKEGSVRMKKLIDALLQYSRLGRTKIIDDVDCMPLLNVLTGDLQSVINRSEAVVNYKDLPKIKGNEVELRLLFQNLITNGIKFTKPGVKPKIDIYCTEISKIEEGDVEEQKFWQFSVADNGIGIAQEYQDRVFAIFQRLNSRLDYEGSGIGLAHCKKIVESHSGKIWFTSSEGAGTTFSFSIPVKV
ncbi:YfiR/HmsC family protein [Algibacter sp. L1A34]|uniref:YfiR/HmsC family protein n=1 Tax=Algibacter sp. L1A34 TaxID=2686365 RepID=UPI00131C4093|nr:YfiR/HmsC family protein [Algibacter sp. L1A34]